MSNPTGGVGGATLEGAAALRREFLAERSYPLDAFQLQSLDAIDAHRSVLVAAPTGSGKTVVAEYAVAQALAEGGRAFYTTPLKALSNQKYGDFVRVYGEDRVGLLTGDVSRNGDGDVVVMTTEVLRNMIYAGPRQLDQLRCVVLDEVHFLEDRYRGSVWEEIILSAPPSVLLVCLSATVSNAEELASWIREVRGATETVIEERRPIELRHLYVLGERSGGLKVLPTFVDAMPNPEALALDQAGRRPTRSRPGPPGMRPSTRPGLYRPRRTDIVERFADEDLLPAIYFVFSRAGCDDAVHQCLDGGIRLTSTAEREEIRAVAEEHVDALSDADLRVLGYSRFVAALESGIGAHHAGLVPPFRETVEDLFARALVKVVFATETLALGINMPARAVIIESLSKFAGHGHEDLTPGEYTQLTGRAGRRGIDEVGYAAVVFSPFHDFNEVASLAAARSRALVSSFRPTYNMAANLVRRYDRDAAYRLVASSFAQFQSERPLTRQLDSVLGIMEDRGYLEDWHLTGSGRRLAGIYHDCDLLIAEAIDAGTFNGLDAPSLVGLLSMLTFEARRGQSSAVFPSSRLAYRAEQLESIAQSLRADEGRRGLPRTRQLDPGFVTMAYDWARGAELANLLAPGSTSRRREPANLAMSGGDFVRNVKQLVDLTRQIATVADTERLAKAARRGAEDLVRGIVAASSMPGLGPGEANAEDPR